MFCHLRKVSTSDTHIYYFFSETYGSCINQAEIPVSNNGHTKYWKNNVVSHRKSGRLDDNILLRYTPRLQQFETEVTVSA